MIALLSLVWAVFSLGIPQTQELDRDNVVILLDASGSMEKPMSDPARTQKMEAAKRAIAEVLQRVPQETQTGLLVFSGRNKAEDWVFPLGPRADAKLIAALNRITPDGGTPLGSYLKKAADRLLEERNTQNGYGSFRMLVVTDGEADKEDAPMMERYLPEILARGIVVDVIGVAMNEDHSLARRVHSYRRADDLKALRQAVAEVFAEVAREDQRGLDSADGFELLAALPDDAALLAIQALTAAKDSPIGSQPAVAATAESAAQDLTISQQNQAAPAGRNENSRLVPILLILAIPIAIGLMRRRRGAGR